MLNKKIAKTFRWMFGRKNSTTNQLSPLLKFVDHQNLESKESLMRLGSGYGGWLLPINNGLNSESICYLAGAGEDISFDCALASTYKCLIRIIDPTPRAIEHFNKLGIATSMGELFPINNEIGKFYSISKDNLSLLTFLPFGLSNKNQFVKFFLPKNPNHVSCSAINLQGTEKYFVAQCYTLAKLMDLQGDISIDLLKMDIEGSEYVVIDNLLTSFLLPRLLLIEFDEVHSPKDSKALSRVSHYVKRIIDAGYICVAVENCNITFVRRERI